MELTDQPFQNRLQGAHELGLLDVLPRKAQAELEGVVLGRIPEDVALGSALVTRLVLVETARRPGKVLTVRSAEMVEDSSSCDAGWSAPDL